ncbi:MAG: GAF domain-containing protein [Solirubrobacteraceae bacterium]
MADTTSKPLMPVEAVDLFAKLLSDAEAGPTDAFYSRLAAATCLLGDMRRAVIFAYDGERRLVRAVGTHGIGLELFAGASPTADQVALAARALQHDQVIEVDRVDREVPEEFLPLLDGGLVVCIPMRAGGRRIGVIVADRPADVGPLTDSQRHSLWSLGKIAGLAAAARHATHEHEHARRLSERIDLARDLHEVVVQRLFGVSLALSGAGDLSAADRERAREEIQLALSELRDALQRTLATNSRATTGDLRDELGRLRRAHEHIDVALVDGRDVTVPEPLQPVAQSVLREAVRNATKHAHPTCIEVRLSDVDGAFVLEVVNDGVRAAATSPGPAGVGLRLAAFEALESGGIIDYGPVDGQRWRVKLTVPQ